MEGSVLETRVRRGLGVEQMGSSGDQNGGSSAGEGRSGGGSAAAPVRAPSSRRFQLEDTSDPDGWVSIVSDGPGPRVPALSAGAERQKNAGGSGGGGGGAIVNFKRFCKKSDGTGQALSKGLGGGGKIVTFEVWPKYTLAGSGGGGEAGARGVAGARRKGVGKATSSRRAYSDESGEENY